MKNLQSTIELRKAGTGYLNNGIELATIEKNGDTKLDISRTYFTEEGQKKRGKGGMFLSEDECLILYEVLGKLALAGKKAQGKKASKSVEKNTKRSK